jgi:membrane-associated protease RseP (regulator of RpoE activity)
VRDRLLTKSDTSDPALKRVLIVRSGLDSMLRSISGNSDGSFTIQFRSSGMPGSQDRMMFESMIRDMQPRVVEAVRGSNITGTINIQSNAPGYLGVSTTTSTFPSVLDYTRSFGYCDYPRVETVDAGSPAEKVGLSAGDTLLAYNKLDLLQYDVNYRSLLVPGKPLHIRFRRDGQIHEVSPIIVPRVDAEMVFKPAGTACADPSRRAECEAPQLVNGYFMGSPARSPSPMGFPAQSASARLVRIPSILYPNAPGQALFGGATLKVVTEAFAKNSGMAAGLLVFDVRENSFAHTAGLREGDVIVSANGTPVRDINGFSNALAPRIREYTAVLQLSSSAGVRTVTMRWQ